MSVVRTHDAFCLDSARRRFFFKDDFLGDQLQDLWTGSGDAGGSGVVVDAQTGGIIRLTTDGDTNDDWSIDWNTIRTLHVSQNVVIEMRMKLSSVANVRCRVPRIFFDGTNNILFQLDTGVDGNWHARTLDGATTDTDTGIVADTDYHVFRIDTFDTPSVNFYIDDVLVATHTTNIPDDAGDFLEPQLFLATLEDVAKSLDIDYIVVSQDRV